MIKFSTELEILIESIKVVLLEKSSERLSFLLKNQQINWERLEKVTTYHAIRPVIYEAFRQIGFESNFTDKLREFCIQQVAKNLIVTNELKHILSILNQEKIRVLPYKGLVFIEKLYKNRQLREVGDLDLIVHPDDKKTAVELLLKDGYRFDEKVNLFYTQNGIDRVFDYWANELGLKKGKVHIDFHWHLYEQHRHIDIDLDELFQEKLSLNNTIFLMLVNHHGGRDCWLRLKYLCDLIMFDRLDQNWGELLQLGLKSNLLNTTTAGIRILEIVFDYKMSIQNTKLKYKKSTIYLIKKYWEIAEHWGNVSNRLRYERIFIGLQDNNFSFLKYIQVNFSNFSTPNPFENPRLVTFSTKHPILNFFSKLISFFVKKTF
jgi:hypothetical protein